MSLVQSRWLACLAALLCFTQSKEEALIVDLLMNKPCVAFSKTYCPYCRRAKETLAQEGAKCEIVELDTRQDGFALQQTLGSLTGRRTVPNIFIGGKAVGGSDDVVRLSSEGALKGLLAAAHAL